MSHRLLTTLPVVASGSVPLVLPQVASATLLLDLRASQLVLNDGDPVSTWADASGLGHDFTRGAGSLGLIKNTVAGHPEVQFNIGSLTNDWMLGSDFADNLSTFAVFLCLRTLADTNPPSVSQSWPIISKMNNEGDGAGWIAEGVNIQFWFQDAGGNHVDSQSFLTNDYPVKSMERTATVINVYTNGSLDDALIGSVRFSDFSNTEPVRIGATGSLLGDEFVSMALRAALIYRIDNFTNWDLTDRAAINAWLATNT